MKFRLGFVSNSSSTSFSITNKSNQIKDAYDFVYENKDLIIKYNNEFAGYKLFEYFEHGDYYPKTWQPLETKIVDIADDEGDAFSNAFCYMFEQLTENMIDKQQMETPSFTITKVHGK